MDAWQNRIREKSIKSEIRIRIKQKQKTVKILIIRDVFVWLCNDFHSWRRMQRAFCAKAMRPRPHSFCSPKNHNTHHHQAALNPPSTRLWHVYHLTLVICLLFCCQGASVGVQLGCAPLRHPGDARLWRALVEVPAPRRAMRVLVRHRDDLVRRQEFILKDLMVLQLQNILDWKRRRGGRTGMHPFLLFAKLWSSCWCCCCCCCSDFSFIWLMTEIRSAEVQLKSKMR